jgi:hypothetical protein
MEKLLEWFFILFTISKMSRLSSDISSDTISSSSECKIPIDGVSVVTPKSFPTKGALSYDSPTGSIYFANGSVWLPIAVQGAVTTLAGDASGPVLTNTVTAVNNQTVEAGTVTGQFMVYDSQTQSWVTNSNVVPAAGNILAWSGTEWVPAGGSPTLAGQVLTATGPSTFSWIAFPASLTFTDSFHSVLLGSLTAAIAPTGTFIFNAASVYVGIMRTTIGATTRIDLFVNYDVDMVNVDPLAVGTVTLTCLAGLGTPDPLPVGPISLNNYGTAQFSTTSKVLPVTFNLIGNGTATLIMNNVAAGTNQRGQIYEGFNLP